MGARSNAIRAGLGTFFSTLGGDLAAARQEKRAYERAQGMARMEGRQRIGEMTLRQVLEQMSPEGRAAALNLKTLQGLPPDQLQANAAAPGKRAEADLLNAQAYGKSVGNKPDAPPSSRAERAAQVAEWEAYKKSNPRDYLGILDAASGIEEEPEVQVWLKRKDVVTFLGKFAEGVYEEGEWRTPVMPAGWMPQGPTMQQLMGDTASPAGGPAPPIAPTPPGTPSIPGQQYAIGDTAETPVATASRPAGPKTRMLAQRAVAMGKARTEEDAIAAMEAAGADISK